MKVKTLIGALFLVAIANSPATANDWWRPTLDPTPGAQPPKWDWQLKTPVRINPDPSISVYEIDMFENERSGMVAQLKQRSAKVICYVDVGSWESWRDDAGTFPQSVLGKKYSGFRDERWLDIRQIGILGPIMAKRFDRARDMGCDAIEPDNIDAYENNPQQTTGFPLTYQDQFAYNTFIATLAHERGMAVGLKNNVNQAAALVDYFDFAVSERCFETKECNAFDPFLNELKPVFVAEYKTQPRNFCRQASDKKISAIRKNTDLDSYREDCGKQKVAANKPQPRTYKVQLRKPKTQPKLCRQANSKPISFTLRPNAKKVTAVRKNTDSGSYGEDCSQ